MDELPRVNFEGFAARLMPGQIAPALFQALPDVIFWMKDDEGRFVYVNQAFCLEIAEGYLQEEHDRTEQCDSIGRC